MKLRNIIAIVMTVLLGIGFLAILLQGGSTPNAAAAPAIIQPTTTSTTAPAVKDVKCTTWHLKELDHTGNRVASQGLPAIADATTPEEARAAADKWLDMIRTDPQVLTGNAQVVLHKEVDATALFGKDGCATPAAEVLESEMVATLALSHIQPQEAPATGYNSGVNPATGQMVAAANPGVTGDRRAILIEMPDGTKIWVMARCINPVLEGPPPLPPGDTDNPPSENPPPGNPPPPPPPGHVTVCRFSDGKIVTIQEGEFNSSLYSYNLNDYRCRPTPPPPPPPPPECPPGTHREGNECPHDSVNGNPDPPTDTRQPPQDNTTSGVNTGRTPGAPADPPANSAPAPAPPDGNPAPDPTPSGSNSGSDTGSGTPGGTTTDGGGTTTGGSTPTNPPADSGQGGGDNTGMPAPPP